MANPALPRGARVTRKEVLGEPPFNTTPEPSPSNFAPLIDAQPDSWQHIGGPLARVVAEIARRNGFDVEIDVEDGS